MRNLWNYISGETKLALTMKQVVSYLTVIMACIHTVLFILFFYFNVYMMAIVNIVSITVYVSCLIWLRFEKSPYVVFNLCYGEVIIHAMLATFAVGSSCGFLLYMVCMIPIAYYAAYSFKDSKHLVNPVIYVLTTMVVFIISKCAEWSFEPMYNIGNSFIRDIIYIINYLLVVITIVAFMSTFLIQIRTLEELMTRKNKKLELLSTQDALTGLSNRRSINESYKKILAENNSFSVILGDIDDFKHINDTYGHSYGDSVLKAVADVFKESVGDIGNVCRWGGEEILVLLPCCNKETAASVAERIAAGIRKISITYYDGESIKVTMTFGVASSDEERDIKNITKKADDRLYYGKKHGKNRVINEDML